MGRNKKILYVDDEPLNLMLFTNVFDDKYHVITAESGIKGLELLQENDFSIVISDMKMPQMNGIEFIEKANSQYPEIHYYILTGYNITDEIRSAIDRKLIENYFQKPFDMSEIESAINSSQCED